MLTAQQDAMQAVLAARRSRPYAALCNEQKKGADELMAEHMLEGGERLLTRRFCHASRHLGAGGDTGISLARIAVPVFRSKSARHSDFMSAGDFELMSAIPRRRLLDNHRRHGYCAIRPTGLSSAEAD
jgi:hypothetical protein